MVQVVKTTTHNEVPNNDRPQTLISCVSFVIMQHSWGLFGPLVAQLSRTVELEASHVHAMAKVESALPGLV